MKSSHYFICFAVVASVAVTGCGGSGGPHATVTVTVTAGSSGSATTLASKIPGCTNVASGTPAVMATGDATCSLSDSSQVEIATFADSADERQWISDGGYPPAPDPAFAGCCIEGNGWAATISAPGDGGDFSQVTNAIGGRQVQG